MPAINLHGFSREKMYGDGIARKSIDHQDVITVRTVAPERPACVARNNLDVRLRIANVEKDVPGNALHQRIDIVETKNIASFAICRQRSRSQTDDSYAASFVPTAEVQRHADSGVMAVVGGRRIAELGGENLRAVSDGAVVQYARNFTVRRSNIADTQGSIEITHPHQRVPLVLMRLRINEQRGDGHGSHSPKHPPSNPQLPGDDKNKQGCRNQAARQLVASGKDKRRRHANEQRTQSPSGGNHQIEGRCVSWRGAQPVQFGVTEQAQEEQGRDVKRKRDCKWNIRALIA